MSEDREKELTDALHRSGERTDYWYQVAQAFCMRLVQQHMPYEEVCKLVREVEMDAATDFAELMKRRRGLYSAVCLEMFEGLRTVCIEKVDREKKE